MSEWINIHDFLPKYNVRVIYKTKCGEVSSGKHIRSYGLHYLDRGYSLSPVTHWMPLPKPPMCGTKLSEVEK